MLLKAYKTMKNWNTDITTFKSSQDKRIWELSQLINYGLDGVRLDKEELESHWTKIKKLLDPTRARMIEYLLWGKTYSLNPSAIDFGNYLQRPFYN